MQGKLGWGSVLSCGEGFGRSRILLVVLMALVVVAFVVAAVPAVALAAVPTLVDGGFESGTDGTNLSSSAWTVVGGPQRYEYDSLQAKNGSLSAWIQGPATAGNGGVVETASGAMTQNGAETSFWVYFDATNQQRIVDDYAVGVATADRIFYMQYAPSGAINVWTDRAGNPSGYKTGAWTPVGTYTTGWTQFRMVYTFTGDGAQTYTLSKRAAATDAWTPLKAGTASTYAIPFRGTNTITRTHGTLWRANLGANLWLDDLTFSEGPAPIDAGFENGADGAVLNPAVWSDFGGTLSRHEYDTATAKVGTTSAWLQAAASGQNLYGVSTPLAVSADGAEITFWANMDTTTQRRVVYDDSVNRTWYLNFAAGGTVQVYTARSGVTGYPVGTNVTVGTYTTGWTQYRVVMDFTTQTYTLSKRASAADAWTPLKAAAAPTYAIPVYAAVPVSTTTTFLARLASGTQMWLDEVAYTRPTTPPVPDTTPPGAPASLSFRHRHPC
jgi:hypothetical protein